MSKKTITAESFASNTLDVLNNMAKVFDFKVDTKLNLASMTIMFGKPRRWGNYKKFAVQTTPGNVLADVKELIARGMKVIAVE